MRNFITWRIDSHFVEMMPPRGKVLSISFAQALDKQCIYAGKLGFPSIYTTSPA